MAVYLVPVDKGRPIVLDKAVVFIGRHPECDVVLKTSRKVSRKHCCLAQVDDRIVVRDLGSMNGIRLNGRRVRSSANVKIGDEVTIGDVNYVLKSRRAMQAEANGSVSGETAPVQPKRQVQATPMIDAPLDISQNFPVPIPEEHADDFEEPTDRSESLRERQRPDDDNDIIMLDDSDEF